MIVTVSNQYGSGAVAIAQLVAAQLGYAFVDSQLPVVVAKRLNVPVEVVEANEDTEPSLGERLLTGLEMATPELAESSAVTEPFDDELLRAVRQAVREYAAHGNAVIVGRGASAILGASAGVLRVFMHAPREWRIARIVAATKVNEKAAAAELDRVDRTRAAFLRDRYAVTFGDPSFYDLCLDTATLGESRAAAIVVAAVRAANA